MTWDDCRDALLAWYAVAARELPWRGESDPYRIWVSEVMLQQTQVDTARPYYLRWLQRFPTVAALAAAPLDDVLALWQGLGYYRRARSLHAGAQAVVAQYGGVLPTSAAGLKRLPGIGDYTAGAIASIAFGERVPAIDGNVNRVLARWLALEDDPRGAGRGEVETLARALVPAASPGEWNQALMELGATLCRPQPACATCPVARWCAGLATGEPTRYPRSAARKPERERLHVAAAIRRDGALLLGRRPVAGRWGGLWELPRVELASDADPVAGLTAALPGLVGVSGEVGAELASLRHAVSGERIRLVVHACELVDEPGAGAYEGWCWTAGGEGLALSTPMRTVVGGLSADALQ